ncbi:MAG: hypothetical protein AAF911_04925 [Planctomycetota bacterium]
MLDRLTESWTRRWPIPAGNKRLGLLVAAALITAALGGLGIPRLSVTGLSGLFDAADPGEQRYEDYRARFDSRGEAIILIDTGEQGENEDAAVRAAFALGESLQDERDIAAVHWGLYPTQVSPKLIRTLPIDDFRSLTAGVAQLQPMLESDTPTALLQAGMAQAVQGAAQAVNPSDDEAGLDLELGAAILVGLLDTFTQRLQTEAEEPVDLWAALQAAAGQSGWELLRSSSGRLIVLRVELQTGVDDQPGYAGSLAAVRRHIETIRLRFEEVELGMTGFAPVSLEAESAIRAASMRAAGGAVFALLLLTGLAWRSVWLPVVTLLLPAVSLVCTLGLIGLTLGQVNLLAMVGVVCSGLTALYGGLMLCGVWARGEDRRAGLIAVGPVLGLALGCGLLVGGWLMATDGRVLAAWADASETPALVGLRAVGFGLVIGSVVAVLTVMLVGPALLPQRRQSTAAGNESRGEIARTLAQAAGRRPRLTWTVALIVLITAGWSATRTPRSIDTSGFLPETSEGALWQQRALEQGGEWGMPLSVIAAGMDEATDLTKQLRGLPEVGGVTGIGRLIPGDIETKAAELQRLDNSLGAAARSALAELPSGGNTDQGDASPVSTPATHPLVEQVRLVRVGLDFLPAALQQDLGDHYAKMKASADAFVATADALDVTTQNIRLESLQRDYDAARRQSANFVLGVLDPAELSLADLESGGGLFNAWFHRSSEPDDEVSLDLRIKVYPAAGAEAWPTTAEMRRFHEAVRQIDPAATGTFDRLLVRSERFVQAIQRTAVGLSLALLVILVFNRVCWLNLAAVLGAMGMSVFLLGAAVGWLSQPMTALAWAVWPVTAMVTVLWIGTCVRSRDADSHGVTVRQAVGGEAFGLVLAAGFIAAAGLRSAGAPGLTATAVAACLAIGASGLWVLLLTAGKRPRASSSNGHRS